MKSFEVFEGELFTDQRGIITSVNDLSFEGMKRFYVIKHDRKSIVRGWNAHQYEKQWLYCVKGGFKLGLVEVDNWERPSKDVKPEIIQLQENKSRMVYVPEGVATCLQATTDEAQLLVFSDKTYNECLEDRFRFDVDYWGDWKEMK